MSDHEQTNYFFRGIRKILVTPFKTGLDLGLMVAGTVMGVLVTVLTASLAVLWAVPATVIFLLLTVPMALYAGVCWLGGDRGSFQWFSYRMEMNLRSLHPLLWEWLTEVWWDMDPTQVATSRNLGMRAVHNLSALVVCLGILIWFGTAANN